MYRTLKKSLNLTILGVTLVLFALLVPVFTADLRFVGTLLIAGFLFILLNTIYNALSRNLDAFLRVQTFQKGNSRILVTFIDRLRFCFTTSDLIKTLRDIVEYSADSTVMLIDMPKRYTVYNSPTIIGTDPAIFSELVRHYDSWRDGVYFFDDDLDLVSDHRQARGFFLVKDNLHCYFFMRFARYVEQEIFPELFNEYVSFLKRNETIEKMFSIAAVSKEWSMVAETQKSFLPKTLPVVKKLDLASYFKPLVNVSGDYYDVICLDEDRTLLILGDVSGKGLAAALIMGIVVNTIRIMEKKDDLELIIRTVDNAIKGMQLQDKYTVLFIGLVNTKEMKLSYINASMADPLVISETRAGRQIRHLQSNCSLIGILDIDELSVDEVKLFNDDVILIASDGISEVSNEEGEMLGDSERWIDFVTDESTRPVQEFVDMMADLVVDHAGGTSLRDDVTVLAAKVRE